MKTEYKIIDEFVWLYCPSNTLTFLLTDLEFWHDFITDEGSWDLHYDATNPNETKVCVYPTYLNNSKRQTDTSKPITAKLRS